MKLPKWSWAIPRKTVPPPQDGSVVQDETPASNSGLAGIGVVFSIGPDKGFYIKSMAPGSAAHDCGILCEGDSLISVDGKEIAGKSPESVTNKILGKVGTPVALKFRRNVVIPDGTPWGKSMFVYISPVLTRGLTAQLPKPAGIGIVFKVGMDGGLVVKSMAEDGPAKLSGKIQLEDCLMGVDGRKVFGQSITQIIPRLVGAHGSRVSLKFRRILDDGKPLNYEVVLARGRKATFRDNPDEEIPVDLPGSQSVKLIVPADARAGDVIKGQTRDGKTAMVKVPEGAVAGTVLTVPVPSEEPPPYPPLTTAALAPAAADRANEPAPLDHEPPSAAVETQASNAEATAESLVEAWDIPGAAEDPDGVGSDGEGERAWDGEEGDSAAAAGRGSDDDVVPPPPPPYVYMMTGGATTTGPGGETIMECKSLEELLESPVATGGGGGGGGGGGDGGGGDEGGSGESAATTLLVESGVDDDGALFCDVALSPRPGTPPRRAQFAGRWRGRAEGGGRAATRADRNGESVLESARHALQSVAVGDVPMVEERGVVMTPLKPVSELRAFYERIMVV